MPQDDDYKQLLTDLIQKQMVVLGPGIALDKAAVVEGLEAEPDGTVAKITADPQLVFKATVAEYLSLSELATKMVLRGLSKKYPAILELKKFET